MTKIEQTRRALYDALAKVRKAKKHPKATDALETALEEHLEEMGRRHEDVTRYSEAIDRNKIAAEEYLRKMREERDDCQERMRVIDDAYRKSQEALKVAGDELRAVQALSRNQDELIVTLRAEAEIDAQKLRHDRLDLQNAEAMTDELHEKLSAATTVIGQLEQLVAGQRKAIADMHNELTHRRVIGKAFMQARLAFAALDEALHEAPQSKAVRAVGDDVVDAEVNF